MACQHAGPPSGAALDGGVSTSGRRNARLDAHQPEVVIHRGVDGEAAGDLASARAVRRRVKRGGDGGGERGIVADRDGIGHCGGLGDLAQPRRAIGHDEAEAAGERLQGDGGKPLPARGQDEEVRLRPYGGAGR